MKAKTVRLLERFSPPGMDVEKEASQLLVGAIAAFIFSLGFVIRCLYERSCLFEWNGLEDVLLIGKMMPYFTEVLGRFLFGFYALALAALLLAALRFAYFYQGSKSIYTMRRLPKRETAKLCLVIPFIYAALGIAAAFALLCLYYWFYTAVTPDGCLPPYQWQMIWSVI